MVVKHSGKDLEVKWLTDKPGGDAVRLFDMTRAKSYGFDITFNELSEYLEPLMKKINDLTPLNKDGNIKRRNQRDED
jgi:hypothetical protein